MQTVEHKSADYVAKTGMLNTSGKNVRRLRGNQIRKPGQQCTICVNMSYLLCVDHLFAIRALAFVVGCVCVCIRLWLSDRMQ